MKLTFYLFILLFTTVVVSQDEVEEAEEEETPEEILESSLKMLDGLSTLEFSCPEKVDRKTTLDKIKSQNGEMIEVSTIGMDYLQQLFQWLASQKHINFNFSDNCFARAHEMARLLESKRVISVKAFAHGIAPYKVKLKDGSSIEWNYHVAPLVKVRVNGQVKDYVLDPSLFDRPVPAQDWYARQSKDPQALDKFVNPRFNYSIGQRKINRTSYDEDTLKRMKKSLETGED